ncbi:fibroblast growth factor 4A isoform X5 [Esox lucius]|uniref:fibroblast growth factor 4A isoform X5 n=1 Tax=Esox lucius TaxID=8010 RepID=UPI00097343D8|nr:fibroblast growth factor 4A isoform X5 [Esox lucius]
MPDDDGRVLGLSVCGCQRGAGQSTARPLEVVCERLKVENQRFVSTSSNQRTGRTTATLLPGFLKLFAMRRGGVVGIRGIKSGLYLCMSREGVAHGAGQFSSDCLFKESLEENFYTTFSSLSHPGIYLALSHKGEAKRGTSVGRHQTCTHFLPRRAP